MKHTKHTMIGLLAAAAVLGCVVLGAAADSSATSGAASFSGAGGAVTVSGAAATEDGRFCVAFRAEPDAEAAELRLCDADGTPLSGIAPDAEGDAELGPLRPGSYRVYAGQTELGAFLLADNAAILRADGRLWTDGELLHLAAQPPGALSVRCELSQPGYYAFTLTFPDGPARSAVLSIPRGAKKELAEGYLRSLLFEGLHAGSWQLWEGGEVCASGLLAQGETAQVAVKIP